MTVVTFLGSQKLDMDFWLHSSWRPSSPHCSGVNCTYTLPAAWRFETCLTNPANAGLGLLIVRNKGKSTWPACRWGERLVRALQDAGFSCSVLALFLKGTHGGGNDRLMHCRSMVLKDGHWYSPSCQEKSGMDQSSLFLQFLVGRSPAVHCVTYWDRAAETGPLRVTF